MKIPSKKNDAYSHPQCSACYIQSIEDDIMSIFELVKNEARLFKFGSGTGTNFSNIRGKFEHLSGGGTSSGLMSFLEVFEPGCRRNQIGWHHAPCCQNGLNQLAQISRRKGQL